MVEMYFFIRFRGQLRRTRPELITTLEDAVTSAASAAGGSVEAGRKILSASFDESRIGFWLDMVIFLERVQKALEKSASELYGYALVLGWDIQEISIQNICRSLSGASSPGSSGIWCSREVWEAMEQYVVFGHQTRADGDSSEDKNPRTYSLRSKLRLVSDRDSAGTAGSAAEARAGRGSPPEPAAEARGSPPEGYRELEEFKLFTGDRAKFSYREKIEHTLAQGNNKNTLLLGPEFLGKRDGIFHYCENMLGDIPPMALRFGAGGHGFICFADMYTPILRSFIAGPMTKASLLEELDTIHNLLFRERLREEWSSYTVEQCRRFIRSLLTCYSAAAKSKNACGVLILEDLSAADVRAADFFKEVYSSLEDPPLILAADASPEESLKNWGEVFSRILKFSSDDFSVRSKIDLPRDHSRDLWELSYNIFLLGQYFPAYLFPQLFEEEGLNRDMYFRSLEIFASYGVVIPDDPRPRIPHFSFRAEKILPDRKEKVRSAVRNCILAWVLSGRLRPCFNLLTILSDLGEGASDVLVLRSLKADVLNGTLEGIEGALKKGHFAPLVGEGNAPVLRYIYKTLAALVWGDKAGIQRAFNEPVPSVTLEDGRPCYGAYQAQMQTNLAAFYIGSLNIEAASEAVRKAMLLNRDLGEDAVPAYRLFSLVNLCRQRIDDALEYISFAVEQSERTAQNEELFLTCYFAASINFLHGNLSKAERLALRAEQIASELGQTGWDMRARFLRGRLCFETGRYRDALDIFESLDPVEPETVAGSAKADESPDPEQSAKADVSAEAAPASFPPVMIRTIRAWIFRTRNFLGRFSPFEDSAVSAGHDAGIFAIEAAYMASDYQRAIVLADSFLSSPEADPKEAFLYTEQPDWESGFSQCEFMFRSGKAPGTKLAWVYRAMAQCALRPAQEAKAEIQSSMQRFMRDELLPDTDPNDAFYFYAWYCMLRDIRASQVDMNTVVSMAYKRLQRRAGRIDDMGTKQAFLNLSRWNSTLCFAAREYKII